MPRPGSAALPGRAPSLGRDVIERDATLLSDAPAPVSSNRRGTGIPSRMRREKSGSWSAAWARASIRLAALTHRCSAPIHAHDAAVRAHRGELYPRQSPSRSRRRAAIASSREHWAQLRARSHGGDREGHPACDQRAAQVSRSGAEGSRTPDLYSASVALSQLSYGPTGGKSEQSRAYSPTAPAGQPDSRGRAQGEPAPGTSTVVARIRAPRWARASARGIAVAARTKSVRRSTPPSMHAMT